MNTNEFYKQLMSEYAFDHEKIKKAAMGRSVERGGKKRLRIAVTACSAAAAAVVAVAGIAVVTGRGNPVSVAPSSMTEQERFELAAQAYEDAQDENTEEQYMYVTFKDTETPTDMQNILLSVSGAGDIKVISVYLDDRSAITGSGNIQQLFEYDEENIDAVKIMCPANLYRKLQDNGEIYLVESGDTFPEDDFTVPDTAYE